MTASTGRVLRQSHGLNCLLEILEPRLLLSAASDLFPSPSQPAVPPGEASLESPAAQYDLTADNVLYTVATSHLDTQWRWTIQDTINNYIPNTLNGNFALFEDPTNPDYVFSFEGAFRYMLAKEYYPDLYSQLGDYIDQGRWAVAGSSIDAGDVNVPSPESLMRHVLYGNGYFRDEFGKTSVDIFLPDCFGFGYALPSVASHMGLKGFSTQKLSWGSSVPLPFDIGRWTGPDGESIVAALRPGAYIQTIRSDLSNDSGWLGTITDQGDQTGVYAGYKYFGVGDRGGAPDATSIDWLETSINGSGPVTVVSAASDQLFRDLTPSQVAALEEYDGEFLMKTHGTGCYTSQAAMKRWNRKNELLADAAERASVVADWLGAVDYEQDRLEEAWVRFLWHQFHDDLPGTSIPSAYEFSWNDEILSLNQFSSVLSTAVGGVTRAMDTQTVGQPIVVYNPVATDRTDFVEASVTFDTAPASVRVYDGTGTEVPSQIVGIEGRSATVQFQAAVPSAGFAVYEVRPSASPSQLTTGLSVTESSLENDRYLVTLDSNGDVSSIYDKDAGRELLSAPMRLELLDDNSSRWPAWEVLYNDVQATPRSYLGGPANVRIVEEGPARVALEVVRHADGSTFVQTISLAAGSDRVEFDTQVDWRTEGTLLKAAFPLTVANPQATYDLGLGTIQRGNNTSSLYEVPAQQWADITDTSGGYGVSVLNDCKYGWDKPSDDTLRLTLLHTPVAGSYSDQATQDLGAHRFTYAVVGHSGDWSSGQVPTEAAELNQPMMAFQAPRHSGTLGRSYAGVSVDDPGVAVRAVKKAEDSDEVIVRLQELYGLDGVAVELSMGQGIVSAREVNGFEEDIGPATVSGGKLQVTMDHYQPRTFALTLAPPPVSLSGPSTQAVTLPFDTDVFSTDADRSDGDFDGNGRTFSGDLLPATVDVGGIGFAMGSSSPGENNALACNGQAVDVSGGFDKLYLLAASHGGEIPVTFDLDGESVELAIQDWDDRVADWGREADAPFILTDEAGWVGTHRHSAGGNDAYVFTNMFRYEIDLPAGATTLTLPTAQNVCIFAMTLANDPNAEATAAHPLYDTMPLASLAPIIDAGQVLEDAELGRSFSLSLQAAALPQASWSVEAGDLPPGMTLTSGGTYEGSPTTEGTFVFTVMAANEYGSDTLELTHEICPDVTGPQLLSADALSTTQVLVTFSEPVDTTTASQAGNYLLSDGAEVFSAQVNPSETSVTLTTSTLSPESSYMLTVEGILDQAQPANPIAAGSQVMVSFAGDGLAGVYYDNMDLTGSRIERIDASVDFDWGTAAPDPLIHQETFSVRWTGQVKPEFDETYTFYTTSDDGVRLWVDGQLLIDNWTDHSATTDTGTISLQGGTRYDIRMEYYENGWDAVAKLEWSSPSQSRQIIPSDRLYSQSVPDTPPVVLSRLRLPDPAGQPNRMTGLQLSFSEDVGETLDVGDLTIDGPGGAVDLSGASVLWSQTSLTATWDFDGLAFQPGDYTIVLSASGVGDRFGDALDGDGDGAGGDDYTLVESVAADGDLNLDGTVSFLEAAMAVAHIGRADANWSDGDIDGNGTVTVGDADAAVAGYLAQQQPAPPSAAEGVLLTSRMEEPLAPSPTMETGPESPVLMEDLLVGVTESGFGRSVLPSLQIGDVDGERLATPAVGPGTGLPGGVPAAPSHVQAWLPNGPPTGSATGLSMNLFLGEEAADCGPHELFVDILSVL